jgi:hypothetical protein
VTQNGSTLTGSIASLPGFQYAGEVDGAGDFILSLTSLKGGTSGGCTVLGGFIVSGNFTSGSVTVSLDGRQVNGTCPSAVNCDTIFIGTLTKTSASQYEMSESAPSGEGASVGELMGTLLQ